jgi:hypothetical protein
VAIALENAAVSNPIGLKPTVDSTVPTQFVARLPTLVHNPIPLLPFPKLGLELDPVKQILVHSHLLTMGLISMLFKTSQLCVLNGGCSSTRQCLHRSPSTMRIIGCGASPSVGSGTLE